MEAPVFQIQHHALLGSTNDEAKRLAEAGCPHGTVIWADEQSAGHGRLGRPWHSKPGNLLFSVVLRPHVPVPRATDLGFVCAVATADGIAGLLPDGGQVGLKWPNDVQVEGAKIAGILPEAESRNGELSWVVLGVGLNVAHAPDAMAYPVTSLSAHGAAVAPETALHELLSHLEGWLQRWDQDGFGVVRSRWLAYARGLGREVTVKLGDCEERGIFRDLDVDGAILLDTGRGIQRITAGDVAFGGP
jgi:BirA family transcriptional regulator, biotin operon repressor / biotin---[acetyl-CoA-carboxylase] ligase